MGETTIETHHADLAPDLDPAPELRPAQRPPDSADDGSVWSTWLFLGGRGAGKTLAGAEWLADQALALGQGGRLALIGPTLHDVREVMIGGVSGLMSLHRWRAAGEWPTYVTTRRRLTFPGGAQAFVFSAEDPDSLRGPQFSAAWADELCAWKGPRGQGATETLAMLRMGLRLPRRDGLPCRLVVTTTPRPIPVLKRLKLEAGTAVSHAPTRDNAANLTPGFLETLEAWYGGTRRAAQELDGQIVEAEGALFTAAMLAACHEPGGYRPSGYLSPPDPQSPPAADGGETQVFDKIVVGVDPSTTATGHPTGIVVVGRDADRCTVLADRSLRGLSPDQWARRVIETARAWNAREIVAEVNQGGQMVDSVLRAAGLADSGVILRTVRATEGKRARAEPVAALYEQGRIRHAARFPELEEELMSLGAEAPGDGHWDRADALIWALTHLMLKPRGQPPRITVL